MYGRSALRSGSKRFSVSGQVITRHPASSRYSIHSPLSFAASHRHAGIGVPRRYQHTHNERNGFIASEDVSSEPEKRWAALEDELNALQNTAIAELEERLGKPIEDATKEDILAIEHQELSRGQSDRTSVGLSLTEGAQSPLNTLRSQGAPTEIIAREARNIFRDTLPNNLLTEEERKVYVRNYGEPADYNEDEDPRNLAAAHDVDVDQIPEDVLLDTQGAQVAYDLESSEEITEQILHHDASIELEYDDEPEQASTNSGSLISLSTGMLDQLSSRAQEVVRSLGGDSTLSEDLDVVAELEDDIDEVADPRAHPLTKMGKFSTSPKTVFIPQDRFTQHANDVMSEYSNKHLKEVCERTFGGPGLPDSPLTPRSGRSRPQIPIPLSVTQHSMGQMEANAYMTVVMPPTYASILSVLVETRKRLGSSWLHKMLARPGGPRVLDTGAAGAGIIAWREVIDAHWKSLHTSHKRPPHPPPTKAVVLTGSDSIRHRAATMLENTTFVPRLPDYVNTRGMPTLDDSRLPQQRKQFDLIIASHSLFELKEEWERKQHVQNLWSMLSEEGGVLILVEKGIPRGFEAVAAARELLLERYISEPDGHDMDPSKPSQPDFIEGDSVDAMYEKGPGMIIGPCTNHSKCPMYKIPGLSKGRRDICSFQQRYIRPPVLQRILGAKDRNHDDVDFSYLAVMKGQDLRAKTFTTWQHLDDPFSAPSATQSQSSNSQALKSSVQSGYEELQPPLLPFPSSTLPPAHSLPRLIQPPLKRRGHVTIDVCTPYATIERWTIPKSFSRQAYRDARKARWGDLWALGAKTIVPRNLRLGVLERELAGKTEAGQKLSGAERRALGRKGRLVMKAQDEVGQELEEEFDQQREARELKKMIDEEVLLNDDDAEEGMIDMDTLLPRTARRKTASTSPRSSQRLDPTATQSASTGRFGTYAKDSELDAWGAELDSSLRKDKTKAGSGKFGGSFAGRGAGSKASKQEQKRVARGLR